ncbi:MAG: peptidase T [Gemmatimonadales bacterium]|nr:peptidase T [Gemmatimonadales bacterium]
MLKRAADSKFPSLVDRFVSYAKIHTTSVEDSETYPSSERQFDLAKILVEELKAVGLSDAAVDDNCYVTATLPATPGCENVPVIAFIAHMDTYPEVSGENVVPTFHENYQGGDIILPNNDKKILEAENPYLKTCIGETIITADGTTLLGADDKAGIAEILESLTRILENPDFTHGTVKIAFTPDEEVGAGVKHFDVEKFGALVAYTMDGGQRGEVEDETFSADSAIVTFVGRDIHPGYAKDKMVPSVKVAGEFLASLPRDGAPETTEGAEGYIHPINIKGNTSETEVTVLIRDFDVDGLAPKAKMIKEFAEKACQEWPGSSVKIEIKEYYRNMKYDLAKEPRAMDYALEAVKRAGIEPIRGSIRGGTDGSTLSAKGLPTPNIFTGEQDFHGYGEWICVKDMEHATDTLLNIIVVWTEKEK